MKIIKKKKDLIPLALFQIMSNKQKETDVLRNQLIKHLDENYNMKKSCLHYASSCGIKEVYPSDEAWESFVNDSLWGNELDAEQFNKELKKNIKKDGKS